MCLWILLCVKLVVLNESILRNDSVFIINFRLLMINTKISVLKCHFFFVILLRHFQSSASAVYSNIHWPSDGRECSDPANVVTRNLNYKSYKPLS